jgi:hypothetical protein
MDVFLTPSQELEPIQNFPASLSPAETSFRDLFDKYQFLRAFIDTPKPHEITPPSPGPVAFDRRIIFRL